MPSEVGVAYLTILPSARGFGTALQRDVGRQVSAVGTSAGKEAGGKFTGAFTGALKGMAAPLAGFFAVDAIIGGFREITNEASSLSETMNKSRVIFGGNADEMEKWAGTAWDSVGLSKQAALESAASFGNMFQQLGFTGDAATKMSRRVVKLAADQGSFNNLPTEDVLERIAAAFRGEYDSLQALIPNINAARVEQQALAMTGKSSADALTAQEKAAATLAIVQEDGAAATNDFAETSDSLANSQKRLQARLDNAQATLGEKLLPALTAGTGFLIDAAEATSNFAGFIGDIPGPVKQLAAAFAAVTLAGKALQLGVVQTGLKGVRSASDTARLGMMGLGDTYRANRSEAGRMASATSAAGTAMSGMRQHLGAVGRAGAGIGGVALAMSDLGSSSNQAVSAVANVASSALMGFAAGGPWGAAIGGAIGLLTTFGSASSNSAVDVDGLTSSLNDQTGALTKNSREWAFKELQEGGAYDAAGKLGIGVNRVTDAALKGGPALASLRKELERIVREGTTIDPMSGAPIYGPQAQAARDLLEVLGSTNAAVGQSKRDWALHNQVVDKGAQGHKNAAGAVAGTGRAMDTAGQKVDGFTRGLTILRNQLEQRSAWSEYQASLDAVGEHLRERRDAQRAVADGERALADAHEAAAEATADAEQQLADAQAESRAAQQALNDARKEGAERLRDMRLQLEGAALSEESAQLGVRSARQRRREVFADPESTALERDEADLAYREALLRIREVREQNADLAQEYRQQSRNGVESTDEVVAAKKRVRDANRGVRDAEKNLADVMADGAESIAESARALRGLRRDLRLLAAVFGSSNEAGRKNREILDGIADNALNVAEGMKDAGKRTDFLKRAKDDLRRMARMLGMDADEARRLANQLLRIPKKPQVKVELNTEDAERKLRRLIRNTKDRRIRASAHVALRYGSGAAYSGGLPDDETHAAGGWVRGRGVAGSGEFVVNRSAARANATLLEGINSGERGGGGGVQIHINSVLAHDYADFMRQMEHRTRRANAGGVAFR